MRPPCSASGASGAPSASSGRPTGVYTTAVGYAGGYTPNPTYEETCSGRTGHAEVVLVVFDPGEVSFEQLLKVFWEDHDRRRACARATTWARSTAARSTHVARRSARRSRPRGRCTSGAQEAGYGEITTEVEAARRLLLRRAVPPAVPRQEPQRLLRHRRHRGQLPHRPHCVAVGPAAIDRSTPGRSSSERTSVVNEHSIIKLTTSSSNRRRQSVCSPMIGLPSANA